MPAYASMGGLDTGPLLHGDDMGQTGMTSARVVTSSFCHLSCAYSPAHMAATTRPEFRRSARASSGADARTLTAWAPRYELLDGLRGLAALTVVMHHLGAGTAGHWAVMAFFVISGYCITASADSWRTRGGGLKAFLLRRARRIYPPYLCALAFFAVTRGLKTLAGGHDDLARTVIEWLQNLTLTQWLSLAAHPLPLAAQNPTLFVPAFWSLNYEEQFYLMMGLCLLLARRLGVPMPVPVGMLAIAGLAWNVARPGHWQCGFFIEYWAHFALGAMLFFVLCKYPTVRVRAAFVAGLVALGAALAAAILPWAPAQAIDRRAFVELLLATGLTLALLALRPVSARVARSPLWRPVAALGTISYSLYLIHQFNLTLTDRVAQRLLPEGAAHGWVIGTELTLQLALATLFWYVCERPFCRPARQVPG